MVAKADTDKPIKFEDALSRLEKIVTKLETGKTDLDEAIQLFEEGNKLIQFCTGKLEETKLKIEILTRKNGTLVAIPFDSGKMNENFTDKDN